MREVGRVLEPAALLAALAALAAPPMPVGQFAEMSRQLRASGMPTEPRNTFQRG